MSNEVDEWAAPCTDILVLLCLARALPLFWHMTSELVSASIRLALILGHIGARGLV